MRTWWAASLVLLWCGSARAQEECWPAEIAAPLRQCPAAAAAADATSLAEAVRDATVARRPAVTPDLQARDLTLAEVRLEGLLHELECARAATADMRASAAYARARLYHQANRFAEAAVLFGAIAREGAVSELGGYAVELYLDALNVRGGRQGAARPACLDRMSAEVPLLRARYCPASGAVGRDDLCQSLHAIECSARRLVGERLFAAERFGAAAEALLRLRDELPRCERLDEVLHAAALALDADRRGARALQVREDLVDAFPASPLAVRALFRVAGGRLGLLELERAAEAYETFARRYPAEVGAECGDDERERGECPDATVALTRAIELRAELGQVDLALQGVGLFQRIYDARRRRQTDRLVVRSGALLEAAARWREAIAWYGGWLRRGEASSEGDLVVLARMGLARSLWRSGDRTRALPEIERVVALWQGDAQRDAQPEDAETRTRRGATRDAVAEALFLRAEVAVDRVLAVAGPVLRGGAPRGQTPEAWLTAALPRWLDETGLARAVAEHGLVSALRSARWSIAAHARVGDMARHLSAVLHASRPPPALRRDPALVALHRAAVERLAATLEPTARTSYQRCLQVAHQLRHLDDEAARCARALAELDPRHAPAETWAPPVFESSDPPAPGPQLTD